MAQETDSLLHRGSEPVRSARPQYASRLWILYGLGVTFGLLALSAYTKNHAVEGDFLTTFGISKIVHEKNEPPAQRYKATQFIAFTVNTLGGLAAHGECEGRNVDNNGVCYLGDKDLTEDIMHRFYIVRDVLEKLKQDMNSKGDHEIDRRDDVLKIFAMPEFYWRGPYGAYTTKQIFNDGALIQMADQLRELIADEAFSNYLFLFGTVIGVFLDDGPEKIQTLEPTDLEYSNFCIIYKGGPTHKHRYLVTKKYISTEDFLSRVTLPNPRNFNMTEYKHEDFPPKFNDLLKERGVKLVTDNFIDLDGLKIGVEICLDHRLGALWANLQKHHKGELMDILIVTSAGMAIERGPNPIVPGGVAYLSDGEASSAACIRSDKGKFDPKTVCRASPDGRKHFPHGGPNYSEFIAMSACLDVEKVGFIEEYYSLYQTQGCAYTLKLYGIDVMDEYEYYPPSIEIYPTVDLPTKL